LGISEENKIFVINKHNNTKAKGFFFKWDEKRKGYIIDKNNFFMTGIPIFDLSYFKITYEDLWEKERLFHQCILLCEASIKSANPIILRI